MIALLTGLMLQAAAPMPAPAAPPPPGPGGPARAQTNLASLFTDSDYPIDALQARREGTVGFRLQVSTDGLVSGCRVTSSSGFTSLDVTTCRLLTERVKYIPARNKRGRPVTDSVVGRIIWRLGKARLQPLEASLMVGTLRVTPVGETSCSAFVDGEKLVVGVCPDPSPRMIKAARLSGRTFEQTIVTMISPEDELEPVDPGDHGTQMLESEVSIDVAPDGSVLECRVLLNEGRGPAADSDGPPNPCRPYRRGRKLFEPASSDAMRGPRRASVTTRGYFRR